VNSPIRRQTLTTDAAQGADTADWKRKGPTDKEETRGIRFVGGIRGQGVGIPD
jgi:hypothetical protein